MKRIFGILTLITYSAFGMKEENTTPKFTSVAKREISKFNDLYHQIESSGDYFAHADIELTMVKGLSPHFFMQIVWFQHKLEKKATITQLIPNDVVIAYFENIKQGKNQETPETISLAYCLRNVELNCLIENVKCKLKSREYFTSNVLTLLDHFVLNIGASIRQER